MSDSESIAHFIHQASRTAGTCSIRPTFASAHIASRRPSPTRGRVIINWRLPCRPKGRFRA